MNYEDFYNDLQTKEKGLKDLASSALRNEKAFKKNMDNGNLAELKKSIVQLKEAARQLIESADEAEALVDSFDKENYFSSGDFSKQFVEKCSEKGLDIVGEKGIYEIFPYRVRILSDTDHIGEIYINRKKIPSARPSYVAKHIKDEQEKLYKVKFNEDSFKEELADAYETTVLKSGARQGSSQSLNKIYRTMAPMARSRRDYDQQTFAFDLARLYENSAGGNWETKDGKKYMFGTSRDGKTGIRVLSSTGVESFISNIRPVNEIGTEE